MRSKISFFIVMYLSVSAAVLFGGGSSEDKTVSVPFSGKISYMTGNVLLNGSEAETGLPVNSGDVVETFEDSFCELIFNERNIIRVESGSILEIAENDFIDFSLHKGSVGVVADKLGKIGKSYEKLVLKTSTSVLGVRGTLFFVKVEDSSNTYICICQGKANTYKKGRSDKKKIKSVHHKAVRYTKTGEGIVESAAPLLYHDDASMELLASKIGIEVEWGGESY